MRVVRLHIDTLVLCRVSPIHEAATKKKITLLIMLNRINEFCFLEQLKNQINQHNFINIDANTQKIASYQEYVHLKSIYVTTQVYQ